VAPHQAQALDDLVADRRRRLASWAVRLGRADEDQGDRRDRERDRVDEDRERRADDLDQAAGEYKVPVRFKGYVPSINPGFVNVKGNLQIAYNELKK